MITGKQVVSGMEREAGGAGAWLKDLETELENKVASGTVKKADTWEEMAALIGADPKVLSNTVATYNAHCDAGYDAEFVKEKKFLLPLRTPPFYAVLGRQGFDTTVGGIKINQHMQVMNNQDRPILGLYATGDCASGWEFANYNLRHPGAAMTFALVSGYFAGEHAAEYSKK
jgi:fumarate reductase flavoprotein subunit